ncbi:MAG: DUF1634 domain-containing protein [Acidobacteria bacterium]|nr:DUF1634 domain-containing protein [Acidobacteriota bacterium]
MNGPSRLDRAIEVALTLGVLASGVLLLAGLALGRTELLRWGIVLLMLTPVARVVVVTAGLFLERDWAFGLISLWILGVLGSSLWMAFA